MKISALRIEPEHKNYKSLAFGSTVGAEIFVLCKLISVFVSKHHIVTLTYCYTYTKNKYSHND